MAANFFQNRPPIESPSQVVRSNGITNINLTNFQYEWTITNFSFSPQKVGEAIESPHFVVGTRIKSKWYLKAFPNAKTGDNLEYLALYLYLESADKTHVEAKCKMFILNENRTETNVNSFQMVIRFGPLSSYGLPKFVKTSFLKDPANACLPNDHLTIVCDLTIAEDSAPKTAQVFKVPESQFHADIRNLFESPKLCDVTLITNNKQFKAHKLILAVRCPFFSSMFEQDFWKNGKPQEVHLGDVPDDVMREVLRFIYTGIAMDLDKMADRLIAAADKFQLDRLKALCVEALCENLAVDNVANRLITSDIHGAVYLKTATLDFFRSHANEVMETENYKALHQTHPHLIDEALRAFAAKESVATTSECSSLDTPNNRSKRTKISAP